MSIKDDAIAALQVENALLREALAARPAAESGAVMPVVALDGSVYWPRAGAESGAVVPERSPFSLEHTTSDDKWSLRFLGNYCVAVYSNPHDANAVCFHLNRHWPRAGADVEALRFALGAAQDEVCARDADVERLTRERDDQVAALVKENRRWLARIDELKAEVRATSGAPPGGRSSTGPAPVDRDASSGADGPKSPAPIAPVAQRGDPGPAGQGEPIEEHRTSSPEVARATRAGGVSSPPPCAEREPAAALVQCTYCNKTHAVELHEESCGGRGSASWIVLEGCWHGPECTRCADHAPPSVREMRQS